MRAYGEAIRPSMAQETVLHSQDRLGGNNQAGEDPGTVRDRAEEALAWRCSDGTVEQEEAGGLVNAHSARSDSGIEDACRDLVAVRTNRPEGGLSWADAASDPKSRAQSQDERDMENIKHRLYFLSNEMVTSYTGNVSEKS